MKIIFWGFKLHTDTFGYVWEAMKKACDYLGHETYWFTNEEHPEDFDYDNCIFFTEGYVDQKIPLRKNSIYFVHVCVNPQKYIGKVKKLIDMRYLMKMMDNDNYDYVLDFDNCDEMSSGVLYDRNSKDIDYDISYVAWGAHLLPHEIDFDWVNIERDNIYYFMGSISHGGRFANGHCIQQFVDCCAKNGVQSQFNNTWSNPLDNNMYQHFIQKSFMSPDLRNDTHKKWGFVPCRLLDSVAYGQLGMTNSKFNQEFVDESILYSDSVEELFELGMKHKDDKDLILKQMKAIKEKHTWLTRVEGLLRMI
jgi:hypothetical protein